MSKKERYGSLITNNTKQLVAEQSGDEGVRPLDRTEFSWCGVRPYSEHIHSGYYHGAQ